MQIALRHSLTSAEISGENRVGADEAVLLQAAGSTRRHLSVCPRRRGLTRARTRCDLIVESSPTTTVGRSLVFASVTILKHRECWGLVVNEAMHVGVPVIATDAVGPAAHGLVEAGEGFVVPERDVAALGEAMSQMFADDQLAARLGRRARERVAAYTFDAMVDAFELAVEYGIERHHRRRAA